ncbi:hypothetical protein [Agrobacterium tumefaciens]|uniref:hypothetical protein n=1 Tax=Agrobacterium tumefaciens TaxID=358 RepID=UPI0027858330|nr:hypothetical protein [Agrobacterium tumefaciens]MDP9854469.1 hypothetical protein [Agrobacterium tumefaciens]
MSNRFCRTCQKKTEHNRITDLLGVGDRDGIATRLFFGAITLGASEAMADRYLECHECGRRTRA